MGGTLFDRLPNWYPIPISYLEDLNGYIRIARSIVAPTLSVAASMDAGVHNRPILAALKPIHLNLIAQPRCHKKRKPET
jgi:hypothetical protein